MHEVTKKPVYRERAEKWWRLMKSRMRLRGRRASIFVWNYWDPAGPWDYKPDGSPKHWVGVHPNGGYYAIDVEGIVTAYEHGLVFGKEDLAAADRHQPRFHVEPADPGRQVPADRRRQARPALEGLARRALDGPGAPRRHCGRCSRRTTSRTVGAVWRRRRGILPCISASSTMFLPVGRLLACGFASDADRQKLSGSRTSPTRRRDCRNPCICPCYRVSFRLYSGRMR